MRQDRRKKGERPMYSRWTHQLAKRNRTYDRDDKMQVQARSRVRARFKFNERSPTVGLLMARCQLPTGIMLGWNVPNRRDRAARCKTTSAYQLENKINMGNSPTTGTSTQVHRAGRHDMVMGRNTELLWRGEASWRYQVVGVRSLTSHRSSPTRHTFIRHMRHSHQPIHGSA